MAITYNWAITQMVCYPEYESQTDVVFQVGYSLTGQEDVYTSSIIGSTDVTYTGGTQYTPYDQLTEAQVIGWVQDALGAETIVAYEAQIAAIVTEQVNNPTVSPPLPWN
jgi:hypothetical protein